MSDVSAELTAGLTVGIAWNGSGDLEPILARVEHLAYVACSLVAPSSESAAKQAETLSAKYRKLRVLPGGDNGIYSGWNKLIFACETRHMCFHGIDDFAQEVAGLSDWLETGDESAMLVMGTIVRSVSGNHTFLRFDAETVPPTIELGRYRAPIGPNVIYPTRVLRSIKGANESFRIAGDVDMFFRARALANRIDSQEIFIEMTDGGMSAAAKHALTVYRENRRIARDQGQNIPLRNTALASAFLGGRYILYRIFGGRKADMFTDAVRALMGRSPRYSENTK